MRARGRQRFHVLASEQAEAVRRTDRLELAGRVPEADRGRRHADDARRFRRRQELCGHCVTPHRKTNIGVYFASGVTRVSTAELQELHVAVQRLLDSVVSGLYCDVPSIDLMFATTPISILQRLRVDVIAGSVRDRYLLELLLLLAQVGIA